MLTFLNKQGKPIIRQCRNCINFKIISTTERTGYCSKLPLIFAFTGEQTVFGITKSFYSCEKHILPNEQFLSDNETPIEMDYSILQKNQLPGI